jgi:hypothetical protein
MAKHTKKILGLVDTIPSQQLESLALPAEFNEAAYQAAIDLDEAYSQGSITDEDLRAKIVTHRDKLIYYLTSFYLRAARGEKRERSPEEH